MWLKVFTSEIFTPRLIIEYLLICGLWIVLFKTSAANIPIARHDVIIATILLTVISTYYQGSSLLRFERIKQYLSLPSNSLSFVLGLVVAVYLWLCATKYSLLITIVVLTGNQINWPAILILGFIVTEWCLILVFELRTIKLIIALVISVILLIASEFLIGSQAIKLALYGVMQIGLLGYFTQVDLSKASRVSKSPGSRLKFGSNYFVRTVLNEPVLLLSSFFTFIFALVFTVSVEYSEMFVAFPFMIVGLNAGLATLLSGQPETRSHIAMLPQDLLITDYFNFIGGYYLIVNLLLAAVMNVVWNIPLLWGVMLALVITLVESLLIVGLEDKWPLTGWKTRGDLWRHGRKYITPLVILGLVNIILFIWMHV